MHDHKRYCALSRLYIRLLSSTSATLLTHLQHNLMSGSNEHTFGSRTVRIAEELCIGSGNCVNLAPEVFRLNEESIVEFVEEPAEIEPERLKEACAVCPVDALILKEKTGKQLIPPF